MAPRDFQGDLQGVNGIQPEARAEQRRLRINVGWPHALKIDGGDDELGEFGFGSGLCGRHGGSQDKMCGPAP